MSIKREISRRVRNVRTSLEKEGINAILLSNPKNIRYLTGKETGKVLITRDAAVLWVKELYKELYSDLYSSGYGLEVRAEEDDAVRHYIKNSHITRLATENLPSTLHNKRSDELGIELVTTDIVERLRSVKSGYEIELLRDSARIAKTGMDKAYEIVDDGIRETDALADIEYAIRKAGSETPPFTDGMLLASGPEGADIHAHAGKKTIRDGELVVVDLGASVGGYYSDMTRTIPVGEPDSKSKEVLEYVRNIQQEAIDRVRPGTNASEIHDFVSKKIRDKGYRFYHSAGHGIGLDVHERPALGPDSNEILKEGMVLTVEPGIYVPRKFGVRFEDMLLMKKRSVEIMTE